MKPLLIGCGLLVGLAVVALIVLGLVVLPKVTKTSENMDRVVTAMGQLRARLPFEPPAEARMIPERLDRVLDVRQKVADAVAELVGEVRDGGLFRVFDSMLRLMPAAGQALVERLESEPMSPDEYLWYADRIAAAIFRGRQPEADPALRRMYQAYKQIGAPAAAGGRVREEVTMGDIAIRAASLDLSVEELQMLINRGDTIVQSMPAILGDFFAEVQAGASNDSAGPGSPFKLIEEGDDSGR
ncbi:MAG: hypothetical protein AB1486_04570 [Planctomycetota bacterium]